MKSSVKAKSMLAMSFVIWGSIGVWIEAKIGADLVAISDCLVFTKGLNMHYIDLLNYLIDVQKIEKDELCELIAIPKKKLDSVLAGATPLKKKCLKA